MLIALALPLSWLDREAAASTVAGCVIAAIGGVLAGAAAERLLHHGEGTTQQLVGLTLTTALGVLTIGYLYLVHLRGPMAAIGTPERSISQTLTFVAFLSAQAAGILLTASRSD